MSDLKTPSEEPTASERLEAFLYGKLGSDWRRQVTVTIPLTNLIWLVRLVEVGIETRRREFKAENQGHMDVCSAASLGSWRIDLSQLVDQIIAEVAKPAPVPKKRRNRN